MRARTTLHRTLAVASMCALFVALGGRPLPVRAGDDDAFKEAEKTAKKDLESADKVARLTAIDTFARTNDSRAATLLQKTLKNEKDPEVITAIGIALGTFTDPDAVKNVSDYTVKYLTGPGHIYLAYNILAGFAGTSTPETAIAVRAALAFDKSKWLNMAALEAMGDSLRFDYCADVKDFLVSRKQDSWETTDQIVPVTAVHALANLSGSGDKSLYETIEILLGVLERFSDDRIRHHTATVMSRLVGLDEPTDRVDWWRYWLERTKNGLAVDTSDSVKRKSNTSARPQFVGMDAIGKRVVFVLDVSKSMHEDISKTAIKKRMDLEEKRKAKGGPAPKPIVFASIKNKLDLAIVDLVAAIESLDDRHWFNIVVYSTESALIEPKIDGFVQATAANKTKFINFVKRVNTGAMTNIHGGMLDAFQITEKGKITGDPAADEQAMILGADSIMFITDGWGSWSNDSKGKVPDPRRPNDPNPVIGDGKYILAQDILRDFKRINKFRKAVVNTVGIGNHDAELMRGFAQASGGTYIDLGD